MSAPEQARDTGGLPNHMPTICCRAHILDGEQARDTGGLREALHKHSVSLAEAIEPIIADPKLTTVGHVANAVILAFQRWADDIDPLPTVSQGAAHEERGLDVARLTKAMYARLPYGNWTQDITAIDRVAAEYARLATLEAAPHVREDGHICNPDGPCEIAAAAEVIHRAFPWPATPEAAPEDGTP